MCKRRSCAGAWVSEAPRIVVAGAGTIGCYVGGRLAAAGRDVTFLGRTRVAAALAEHGLTVSDFGGVTQKIAAPVFSTDPAALNGADLVLVAVKSGATEEIAAQVATHAPAAVVMSLQNGISNADTLREVLPGADVRATVVGFNVVQPAPGTFHQATSGDLMIEEIDTDWAEYLTVPGLNVEGTAMIREVQWGKLLVNLNNALNALSGLTLLEQLQDRDWRRLLAAQMSETLRVLRAAGIQPARFTAAPPGLVPHILRLPTPLFSRIARAMLTIDPEARSSMQDDLAQGRMTEIDMLQGEVLRLAETRGVACPVLTRVRDAVKEAQVAGQGPPALDPRSLFR